MKTSTHEYRPDQLAHIASLLEGIEYHPVKLAVVDYLGMRDADGLVTATTGLDRRFGTRDLRHVSIYGLTVVCLNRTGRTHEPEDSPLARPFAIPA
ncbi:hypothetical protein RCRUDOLPH_81 [Rhodobacter phage RcRudolph]|nr:hypothetical protein RCRUDOLPH_81 [Rhodobacter phage RcRudolph]